MKGMSAAEMLSLLLLYNGLIHNRLKAKVTSFHTEVQLPGAVHHLQVHKKSEREDVKALLHFFSIDIKLDINHLIEQCEQTESYAWFLD